MWVRGIYRDHNYCDEAAKTCIYKERTRRHTFLGYFSSQFGGRFFEIVDTEKILSMFIDEVSVMAS